MLRIIEQADADILCFGHAHKPYHRILASSEEGKYRHAINIGSVGKPKDGNPQGCYVLLTIGEHSSSENPHSISVEFIRFGYDIEKQHKQWKVAPYRMLMPRCCEEVFERWRMALSKILYTSSVFFVLMLPKKSNRLRIAG